jgi:hypothetical protein
LYVAKRCRPPEMAQDPRDDDALHVDWQSYVRRAHGPVLDDDFDADCGEMLLSPNLPPPATLPARNLGALFSSYSVLSHDGRSLRVPCHMVVRDYTSDRRGIIPDRNLKDVPDPGHVVVLMARDAFGDAQHGWFIRTKSDPLLLRRMSFGAAEGLWTSLRNNERLKHSSLNATLMDVYFSNGHLDFETLLSLRLESLKTRHSKLVSQNKRKRKPGSNHAPNLEDQRSKPASPDRLTQNGRCAVCLEDCIEVHATSCCGTAGATCSECRAKLRHYCPICSRQQLNGSFHCLSCNRIVALKDYGMPCSSCDKCVLCTGCYKDVGECVECDIVRCQAF